MMIVENS